METTTPMETRRIIGIRHRIKRTSKGEARPTQLVILEKGVQTSLELETDDDELDFVLTRLPTGWRKVTPDDMPTKLPSHHVKWRRIETGTDLT